MTIGNSDLLQRRCRDFKTDELMPVSGSRQPLHDNRQVVLRFEVRTGRLPLFLFAAHMLILLCTRAGHASLLSDYFIRV